MVSRRSWCRVVAYRNFKITPDPARLPVAGVTVADILDAIRRTNLIDSPGLIESDHHLVLALVSGQVHTAEQIGNIVVKTSSAGVPIRITDVATVASSVAPTYTIVTANGKPAVLLNINRQPDSNTLQVANEAHDLIQSLTPTLPPGVRLEPFYDQSTIVHDSIASVRDAVLLGIVLSSVVLVLFLRDWGTSLVAGLVIPVTLLITFVVLKVTGQSFNLMTLGGLAAAVGLVIDDAIVVLENIVLHRDAGQDRFRAIQSACARTDSTIDRFHNHSYRRVPAADRDHGRNRKLLPGTGGDDHGCFAHFSPAGSYLDPDVEPIPCSTGTGRWCRCRRRSRDASFGSADTTSGKGETSVGEELEMASLLAAEDAHATGFFGRVIDCLRARHANRVGTSVDSGGKLLGDRRIVLCEL